MNTYWDTENADDTDLDNEGEEGRKRVTHRFVFSVPAHQRCLKMVGIRSMTRLGAGPDEPLALPTLLRTCLLPIGQVASHMLDRSCFG